MNNRRTRIKERTVIIEDDDTEVTHRNGER
jgi:hypothetical protein